MRMIFLVCLLILLFSFTHVYSQLDELDDDDTWKPGYHPFPEMSRFLNSDSRIHHQFITRSSASRPSYSLLEYICSIANNNQHIEEILIIFGEKYRSIIKTIIKKDCPNLDNKRDKRTTINIKKNKFSRILFHRRRRL